MKEMKLFQIEDDAFESDVQEALREALNKKVYTQAMNKARIRTVVGRNVENEDKMDQTFLLMSRDSKMKHRPIDDYMYSPENDPHKTSKWQKPTENEAKKSRPKFTKMSRRIPVVPPPGINPNVYQTEDL